MDGVGAERGEHAGGGRAGPPGGQVQDSDAFERFGSRGAGIEGRASALWGRCAVVLAETRRGAGLLGRLAVDHPGAARHAEAGPPALRGVDEDAAGDGLLKLEHRRTV